MFTLSVDTSEEWCILYLPNTSLTFSSADPQSKLLKKAESLLVKEKEQKEVERENTLRERAPPLNLSGLSVQELQVQHFTVADIYIESCYCGQMAASQNISQHIISTRVHGVCISDLSWCIIIRLCRSFVEICTTRLTLWMMCGMTSI